MSIISVDWKREREKGVFKLKRGLTVFGGRSLCQYMVALCRETSQLMIQIMEGNNTTMQNSFKLGGVWLSSCPEVFVQEFSVEIASHCIVNKSLLVLGLVLSLILKYSIFKPSKVSDLENWIYDSIYFLNNFIVSYL